MKTGFKIIIVLICLGVVGFFSYRSGFVAGEESVLQTPPTNLINPSEGQIDEVDFSIFWEAWRSLERDFLNKDKILPQVMVYGAVRGMTKSLEDPHTNFFDPDEAKDFEEGLSGKYQGVGMFVGIKKNQLTVISPLKGTPAQEAGLRAGDKIIEVDDEDIQDMSLEKAISLIKGPEGTTVRLLIFREGWSETREFSVKRAVITIPTVEWELLGEDEDIAWIKLYHFNRVLTSQFAKESIDIIDSSAEKIILDLRNNPGGYLDVAVGIAGWFLEQDQLVVTQEAGTEGEEKIFHAEGPARLKEYPVVILINEGSASGSEILAGALRDNRGVTLIGETSFGKGSVQKQVSLSDGSSLKITIAKWLTPKGHSISEEGLVPDIMVELTEEDWQNDRDPQLNKAVEVLKNLY